jgi:uncharacterized protein YhbP (UPF0306 family)
MTLEEFTEAVRRLLDEVTTMTLATCAGGIPWAADVYFAPDGFDLVFFSSPDSRHCRNLAANPVCAVTIHPAAASWREIRGLQMEGEARPAAGTLATARALAAYLAKFPFARELLAAPKEGTRFFAKASAQIFRPRRIRYLDNALGLGTRFGLLLANGKPAGSPEREENT